MGDNSVMRKNTYPQSWDEAHAMWTKTRKRKLDHNTYLVQRDRIGHSRRYAIRLHTTDIVTFQEDGTVVLNSGGWQTPTTRDRMGNAGFSVGMESGIAALYTPDGRALCYRDGMTIGADWAVTGHGGDAGPVRKERKRVLAKFRRIEKKYNAETDLQKRHAMYVNIYFPWYWPGRQGGQAIDGNAPEALGEKFGESKATWKRLSKADPLYPWAVSTINESAYGYCGVEDVPVGSRVISVQQGQGLSVRGVVRLKGEDRMVVGRVYRYEMDPVDGCVLITEKDRPVRIVGPWNMPSSEHLDATGRKVVPV